MLVRPVRRNYNVLIQVIFRGPGADNNPGPLNDRRGWHDDQTFSSRITRRQKAKAANVVGRVYPDRFLAQQDSGNGMVERQSWKSVIRLAEPREQNKPRVYVK